jgi:hypothetical protein
VDAVHGEWRCQQYTVYVGKRRTGGIGLMGWIVALLQVNVATSIAVRVIHV